MKAIVCDPSLELLVVNNSSPSISNQTDQELSRFFSEIIV